MKELSESQIKLICDFLNMTAAAWFSAGIIAPFFTSKNTLEKFYFIITGIGTAGAFLTMALMYARRVKS